MKISCNLNVLIFPLRCSLLPNSSGKQQGVPKHSTPIQIPLTSFILLKGADSIKFNIRKHKTHKNEKSCSVGHISHWRRNQ